MLCRRNETKFDVFVKKLIYLKKQNTFHVRVIEKLLYEKTDLEFKFSEVLPLEFYFRKYQLTE